MSQQLGQEGLWGGEGGAGYQLMEVQVHLFYLLGEVILQGSLESRHQRL